MTASPPMPDIEARASTFEAYAAVLRTVAELVPGMRVVPVPGAGAPTLILSSLGLPSLDRALLPRMSADSAPAVIDAVTAEARTAGVKVNWWLDPDTTPAGLDDLLLARGYESLKSYPLMSRPVDELPAAHPPVGFELAWVGDVEVMRESQLVAGRGFGRLEEAVAAMAEAMASPEVVSDPRAAVAVARRGSDGLMLGSGQLVMAGAIAGILNVATLPEARGRGIGTAVTIALFHEAKARGATLATLHASPLGFPIYQRLGFRHEGEVRVLRGPTGAE